MESDRPVILSAQGLGKRLALGDEQLSILTGIDLEIKAGDSVALVGASGSGKTTLLGLLAGLDTPTEGTVNFAGQPFSSESEDRRAALRAEGIAFVFQNFQLLGALTALENVMIPLELAGREAPEALARSYLERVGLGDRARHTPRQLSGGEQQRVALARAFAAQPKLLFADEPTGNLDQATGQRIADLLFELNAEAKTTLVLVTHDPALAARCDRALRMEAGQLHAEQDLAP
jgi:putative ABC transport system ATP-binding protein